MRNRWVRGPVLAGLAMALCCAGVTGAADPFGEGAPPPASGPGGGWPPPWVSGSEAEQAEPWPEAEAEVVRLLNTKRAEAGCSALGTDEVLAKAAREHSQARAGGGSATGSPFLHEASAGDRARDLGYDRVAGEVVARGFETPEEAVRAWTSHSGHDKVLMRCSAKEVGAGVVHDEDGPFWTLVLGYGS
ncbi:SCP-like extracellular protein [Nocardiopsis sp. TSRI0078]|uniref:CAP domain-containing protein n=1 Tax=unclassified Nocardiopsis TaxID=2649073 RepID=UPI00093E1D9F|nr:CAP domain-containing protein [Nocardiopsis sp. TSRI0078]OKI16906.1 SCP-like extracellular protein [Nocardiopsis sp. TSRI0078]